MSWCDKLASTPTVGFTLDSHFASSSDILDIFISIFDSLVTEETPKFNVERQGSFDVTFNTEEGFQYSMTPSKIVVTFNHRMKLKAVSGGPPMMEMLSVPAPYTTLLAEASRRLSIATSLLMKLKTRTVHRVGVVATTRVALDEIPPGIARFIEHIGRPWQSLEAYNVQMMASLDRVPEWSDRCIHHVVRYEKADELPLLVFDWQRTFSKRRAVTSGTLETILSDARTAALKYFEELAEGNRFDENFNSGAT